MTMTGHRRTAPDPHDELVLRETLTETVSGSPVELAGAEPAALARDAMALIDSAPDASAGDLVIDLRDPVAPHAYRQPSVDVPSVGRTQTGTVLLVGSSGGHLAQLVALQPWWADRERAWVTFQTPDAVSLLAGEHVTWASFPTTRNIPNLLRNAVLAAKMLRRDRPAAIVTTGAGVALPYFVIGRLLGIPTIYIEVYDRIDSRTLTARLCRPFTSRMLVQWEEQRSLYPNATLVGTLL